MRHKTSAAAQLVARHPSPPGRGVESDSAPSTTALHFKIDRLTLEGYSNAEQKRFTRSLQAHLAELAGKTGSHQWSGVNELALDRMDAGRLSPNATPEAAARQVAERIVARLAKMRDAARTTSDPQEGDHA